MIASVAKLPSPLEIVPIADEPAWLSSARRAALRRFSGKGLPSVKEEDWRFTNVAPLAGFSFDPASRPAPDAVTRENLAGWPFAGGGGTRLVFVNGYFSPELSSLSDEEEGVRIMGLADALVCEPARIEPHLFHLSQKNETSFAALNAALFQDGAFIHIFDGRKIAGPVRLLCMSTKDDEGKTIHPRHLIVVGKGAEVTLTESYFGADGAACFTNSVTELIVGDNASVEYLKLQDEGLRSFHLATLAVGAGRDSRIRVHSMAFGGKLSRTNLHATLAGEGAECVLNGLYLVRDEQIADHYMIVDHAVPRGTSHEFFNGIFAGKSRGVFHGRIIVRPGAQKTDAKQTNKNLLLSEDATVNTKPQLEIYADDVKCTHGATVGQLSDEAVFYLRARGIPLEKARQMLIQAFAGEIIDRIQCEKLREALHELVGRRLEQNEEPRERGQAGG